MCFHAFLKIVLKVINPLYIESHRIPIKAGADPIAIHSGGLNARRSYVGFLVLNTKPGTEFDNYIVILYCKANKIDIC